MIRSAEEAKEILRIYDDRTTKKVDFTVKDVHCAEAYLAALEGPEVQALVDRLETLANALPPKPISMNIGKALAQYREAVKP